MTLMIFVLVLLTPGGVPTGTELYFQELTSCLEYRDALVHQSVHDEFVQACSDRIKEFYGEETLNDLMPKSE